jgi:hypothetical protein
MNLRPLPILGVISAFLFPFLLSEVASAQQADGVRFRGGVGLEVGGLVVTQVGSLGAIGVQGQLGVQINNNWAVYATPSFDVAFGDGTGVSLGFGALADYTFNDIPIAVGAGPTAGTIVAFGNGGGVAGAFYGAKAHGAWYPIMARGENGIRRRALYVALDLSILGFSVSGVDTGGTGIFLISPTASVGYAAF